MTDEAIRSYLTDARTIAVIGLSGNPDAASAIVARYLFRQGYRIVPVNPNLPSSEFGDVYASVADITDHIDIIDIFRKPEHIGQIIDEVGLRTDAPMIWVQEGIRSAEAKKLAQRRRLPYLEDRCIMKEHARLIR